jgi:hypothetical protein
MMRGYVARMLASSLEIADMGAAAIRGAITAASPDHV